MNISFPAGDWPGHLIDPLEIPVDVDGVRVRARIDLSTLEVLNPGGASDSDTLREFASRNRLRFERAIEAHLYARGFPPKRVVVIGPEELRE